MLDGCLATRQTQRVYFSLSVAHKRHGARKGRCICSYLQVDRDHSRAYSVIPNSTDEGRWSMENVGFCTSAVIICASNGSHVALPQHLLSFVLNLTVKTALNRLILMQLQTAFYDRRCTCRPDYIIRRCCNVVP